MNTLLFSHENEDEIVDRVVSLEFSPIVAENLKKHSVCPVLTSDLYTKNREPKYGGINDSRMGTTDINIHCATCKGSMYECPGHFGHVNLAAPVYNPLFLKWVVMLLNITCCKCFRVYFNLKHITIQPKKEKRLSVYYKQYHNKQKQSCHWCNEPVVWKYAKDGMLILKTHRTTKNKLKFFANEALEIIEKLNETDIQDLGFNLNKGGHPKNLLFTVFPILPPCARPCISFGCNLRSEDDMVYKLVNLIKANQALSKKMLAKNQTYLDIYRIQLQWAVTTFIDNNIKSIPQSQHRNNSRPLKSLKERIKGKDGRFRANILGKRVNFSARTVIDPDACIAIDEVGVPIHICTLLCIPEKVHALNIQRLTRMVHNGSTYPGANYLLRNNNVIDLKHINFRRIQLYEGETVYRHLLSQDYVLFNRQPSLHKMSMMGHRIRPVHSKSFRLNPAVTKPYNADFDGDEMNIIIPQSDLSMMEIRELAAVNYQIISPQSGGAIIGSIMDNVLSCYLMSLDDCKIPEHTMKSIVLKTGISNYHHFPKPISNLYGPKEWTGKSIFSMCLPKTLNYNKHGIKIVNGQLVSGKLNKKTVGVSRNGLIHYLCRNYGYQTAANFINRMQALGNQYLKLRGFTVGYDDIQRSPALRQQIKKTLDNTQREVNEYIVQTFHNKRKIFYDEFEQKIFNVLNKARDDIGSLVMDTVDDTNSFYQMIYSGSKGNPLNISQMLGSVGQQNIQWRNSSGRAPCILNNRTLPYFHQFDLSPEARGFIESSYVEGLNVTEFFFHCMAGREGVIDTSVKTSDIGYMSRKLVKSLEDIKLCYDMTIRNEGNRIVQFTYGTNNINTTSILKLSKEDIPLLGMERDKFIAEYMWTSKEVIMQFSESYARTYQSTFFEEWQRLCRDYQYAQTTTTYEQYVDVEFIIQKIIQDTKYNLGTPAQPHQIIETSRYIRNKITTHPMTHYPYNEINEYNNRLMYLWIDVSMSSKYLMQKRITTEQLEIAKSGIITKFYQSLIDPGTAVGVIASSSITEPCTQLCVDHDAMVHIKLNQKDTCEDQQKVKIGPFIDSIMQKHSNSLISMHLNDPKEKSYILNMSDVDQPTNILVPGINQNTGEVSWKPVTQLSKHPVYGRLVKVTTATGKTIIATPNHSFITRERKNGKFIVTKAKSLSVGTELPIYTSE